MQSVRILANASVEAEPVGCGLPGCDRIELRGRLPEGRRCLLPAVRRRVLSCRCGERCRPVCLGALPERPFPRATGRAAGAGTGTLRFPRFDPLPLAATRFGTCAEGGAAGGAASAPSTISRTSSPRLSCGTSRTRRRMMSLAAMAGMERHLRTTFPIWLGLVVTPAAATKLGTRKRARKAA